MIINVWSDLHNYRPSPSDFSLSGDLFICCGDLTNRKDPGELKNSIAAIGRLEQATKIITLGNHDYEPTSKKELNDLRAFSLDNGVHLLIDEAFEINGLKIYGYPWTPEFNKWNWMKKRNSSGLQKKINLIPEDVDILISHGPPLGFLDTTFSGELVGCELLREWLLKSKKLKMIAFGHIHESYGIKLYNETIVINASFGYHFEHKLVKHRPVTLDYHGGGLEKIL